MSPSIKRLICQWRSVLVAEGCATFLSKVGRYMGSLIVYGFYDAPICKCLLTFSSRRATFLDIGAHKGGITLVVSHAFKRCIAVEPSPDDAEQLRRTFESRRLSNCEVVECALGAKAGFAYLYMSSVDSGDKALVARPDLPERKAVLVMTLDSLADQADIKPPCVLKLDAQGFEPFVCQGGRRLLLDECVVVSEFWPWGIKSVGADPRSFIKTMADMGFVALTIEGRRLTREKIGRLIHYGDHDRYVTTDLLFVKNTHSSRSVDLVRTQ